MHTILARKGLSLVFGSEKGPDNVEIRGFDEVRFPYCRVNVALLAQEDYRETVSKPEAGKRKCLAFTSFKLPGFSDI